MAAEIHDEIAVLDSAMEGAVPELSAVLERANSHLSLSMVVAGATWLATWVANTLFLVGPVLMFVPQYKSIRDSGTAKSFSTTVCFVLLTAHLMRLFFWIGKRFETVLLLQSVIVVISQLILLRICVKCNYNERLGGTPTSASAGIEMTAVSIASPRSPRGQDTSKERSPNIARGFVTDFTSRRFWKWDHFGTYLVFLSLYVLVLFGLTVMFLDNSSYFEVIGFLALCTEATLSVPQGLRNHRRKSTDGLSLFLVFNWIVGDSARFVIFYLRQSPVQFLASAGFCIAVDVWVLLQVVFFFPNARLQAWWASARRGACLGGGIGVSRTVSWLLNSRARTASTDDEDDSLRHTTIGGGSVIRVNDGHSYAGVTNNILPTDAAIGSAATGNSASAGAGVEKGWQGMDDAPTADIRR